MNLNDVYAIRVPRTARRRVGRGWGSGLGKTSGRGEKGQGRRSGEVTRLRFEGGQMPLYRRLPKKGFSNHAFRVRFEAVNVGDLDRAFAAGATVDLAALRAALLVPKSATLWKALGDGELTKALTVHADAASAGARAKIEKAGGTVTIAEGPARSRLEATTARREALAKRRAAEVEAYKAEAVKAGKPKKAAAPTKKAKGTGERPAKPAGEGKPAPDAAKKGGGESKGGGDAKGDKGGKPAKGQG
jgi:large subunit ribosomal protein L15